MVRLSGAERLIITSQLSREAPKGTIEYLGMDKCPVCQDPIVVSSLVYSREGEAEALRQLRSARESHICRPVPLMGRQ